jgi:hypothetical protein
VNLGQMMEYGGLAALLLAALFIAVAVAFRVV